MLYNHLKSLMRKDEKIWLQTRTLGAKSGVGSKRESWADSVPLIGSINETKVEQKNEEGEYDSTGVRIGVGYTGYFMPFNIPNSQEYRVKRIFEDDDIVELYDIVEFHPNLIRRNKQHHVELRLRLI